MQGMSTSGVAEAGGTRLPAAERGTPRQRQRRSRILEAGASLAIEGGYGAVGMREVAARADVALATVYHYFPSKDHLLLGVMVGSLERLRTRRPPSRTGDVADRVLAVVEQATRSMFRNPKLSSAIVRAWVVFEGADTEDEARIGDIMRQEILAAMSQPAAPATPENLMRIKLLTRVWFSELLFWANGRESDQELLETVEAAARHLFTEPSAPTD
jgi:AcrR family transcriptional regulator